MKIKYTLKQFTLLDDFLQGKCNIKPVSLEDYIELLQHLEKLGVNFISGSMKMHLDKPNINPDFNLAYLNDDVIEPNLSKLSSPEYRKERIIRDNRRLINVSSTRTCGWSQDIKDRPIILSTDIIKEINENKVDTK